MQYWLNSTNCFFFIKFAKHYIIWKILCIFFRGKLNHDRLYKCFIVTGQLLFWRFDDESNGENFKLVVLDDKADLWWSSSSWALSIVDVIWIRVWRWFEGPNSEVVKGVWDRGREAVSGSVRIWVRAAILNAGKVLLGPEP